MQAVRQVFAFVSFLGFRLRERYIDFTATVKLVGLDVS